MHVSDDLLKEWAEQVEIIPDINEWSKKKAEKESADDGPSPADFT